MKISNYTVNAGEKVIKIESALGMIPEIVKEGGGRYTTLSSLSTRSKTKEQETLVK